MNDVRIWNEGEKQLQERVGLRDKLEHFGAKIMRPSMPWPHRELFAKVPFLVIAGMKGERPASAIVSGAPGWVTTPDDRTLRIDVASQIGDLGAIAVGDALGILSIELATRRRNRLNGHVTAREGTVITVTVDVSFGNCPQYIQAREVGFRAPQAVAPREEGAMLGADALAVIARADTFFLASAARPDPAAGPVSEGVDVSHRGGRPGFVVATQEDGRTVLTWPDYPGNNFFNSLGNLVLHPWAGLLFVDFVTASVLTVSGSAEIVWDDDDERSVRVYVDHARLASGALPLRFSAPELAEELE